MPSRILVPRVKSNVRWVQDGTHPDDGHFEMWCPDCQLQFNPGAEFWPLTVEFWNPNNMQRCRACNRAKKRRHIRATRRAQRV